MTSIAFGGGPTLNERRSFAGLKYGTHVPGYRGYCPQIKYRVGRTYGDDTNILAKDGRPYREPVQVFVLKVNPDKTWDHVQPRDPTGPEQPRVNQDNLPDSTGDNKLTKSMVPGYTGYIPRSTFKYGNTYKEGCDVCIDEHLTNLDIKKHKMGELKHTVRSIPKLQAVARDPGVRDELNRYRDTHPQQPTLIENRRAWCEPPIPGYRGYIPRIKATELGLGGRYHETTKSGLEAFAHETSTHHSIQQLPITVDRGDSLVKMPTYNRRLYLNDGMIPKYTGYCPQRRYQFGNTYGDTTRSLEVCKHKDVCYGDTVPKGPTVSHSIA